MVVALWPSLCLAFSLSAFDGGVSILAPVEARGTGVSNTSELPTVFELKEPSAPISLIEVSAVRGEAKELAEVLLQSPGVVMQDTGGVGTKKTISLRGANANAVLILLDGIPLTNLGNAFDLSRIPLAALSQVQVMRGASSRLGPGGMGGAVNLVTRSAQSTSVSGEVSAGSFDTYRANSSFTSPLGRGGILLSVNALSSMGDFLYAFDATPNFSDALTLLKRQNNAVKQIGFLSKYNTNIDSTQLHIMLEGLFDSQQIAGTVQNPTVDERNGRRGTLSARTNTLLSWGATLSSTSFLRVDDVIFKSISSQISQTSLLQREFALGTELTYSQLIGRHGVSALVSLAGEMLNPHIENSPAWFRSGVMLSDEVFFFDDALALNASVRLDTAGTLVVLSPKLGAAFVLPFGFTLKASGGQSSRPPSFFERYVRTGTLLPNADLRPERALTADATIEWKNKSVQMVLTGFGHLYEDLIVYEYYPPFLAKPFNVMAASVVGLEASIKYEPHDFVHFTLDYTYLSTQNLRDDPRYYLKSLPYRPSHRVYARADFGVPMLGGQVELLAQSAQYINRTATVELPARAFVNWGVKSRVIKEPELVVAIEVKNLFDVQSQDFDGYPLLPRSVFATVSFVWSGKK
jgi:vitamin B12 transporter